MLGLTAFAEIRQALDHIWPNNRRRAAHAPDSVRFGSVWRRTDRWCRNSRRRSRPAVGHGHPSTWPLFHDDPQFAIRADRSHACATPARPDVSVLLLNMGQPVKIVDLMTDDPVTCSPASTSISCSAACGGRESAERDPVRERGAHHRDRDRRRHGGQAQRTADGDVARVACCPGTGDRQGRPGGHQGAVEGSGAGIRGGVGRCNRGVGAATMSRFCGVENRAGSDGEKARRRCRGRAGVGGSTAEIPDCPGW